MEGKASRHTKGSLGLQRTHSATADPVLIARAHTHVPPSIVMCSFTAMRDSFPGLGCSSMVELFFYLCKALALIPAPQNNKKPGLLPDLSFPKKHTEQEWPHLRLIIIETISLLMQRGEKKHGSFAKSHH